CVLPGTSLPLGKNGEYLERFFKDNYDINVEYLVEAKTVPGKGHMHNRIDQIFTVQEDSVEKFAKIKNEMNAEYAKDIVRQGNHRLPISTIKELDNYKKNTDTFHQWENYFDLLQYKVLSSS